MIRTISNTVLRVQVACAEHPELLQPKYRDNRHPLRGHCYIACEVVAHLHPRLKPHHVAHEGSPHWFLKAEDGSIIDPTAEQFSTPVPYSRGRGCGFLTKELSKRARLLLSYTV